MITLQDFPGLTIVDDFPNLITGLNQPRSKEWNKFRINIVKQHPFCAYCKNIKSLQVHHIKPFHLWPEFELNENNVIVLCEEKDINCHLKYGHLGDWTKYNPLIKKLVYFINNKPSERDDSLFIF